MKDEARLPSTSGGAVTDPLDMALREFFAMAEKVGEAARVIAQAQAMMGAPASAPRRDDSPDRAEQRVAEARGVATTGVLRSTPQPSSAPADPPEGLTVKGRSGIEIIAERQREDIQRRAEARGESVALDPKLGLVDAEALAVKARLKLQREEAERAALAKMTPEERKEFEQ